MWAPDAKGSRILSGFKIYPALPISENKDFVLGRIQKILDWVALEIIPIISWGSREALVKVRMLFESETLFAILASVTAEIPKDF